MFKMLAPVEHSQGYRPWLDGLRAIAIVMVFIEHSNLVKGLPFGSSGVGLFFALSGFLITGLLFKELQTTGSINLRRFYIRRLGRLTPGLLLCVAVCSVIFLLVGEKHPVLNGLFALTYTTNYAAIIEGHHLKGFGHTWSLAVEEHFYLFWPLALIFLWKRMDTRGLAKAIVVIALTVMVWRVVLVELNAPQMLFYAGSIERLDAMMYGCLFAVLMHMGWSPKKRYLILGLVLLSAYFVGVYPLHTPVLNSAVLGLSGALIVAALDNRAIAWVNRVLSTHLLVKIGLLSYTLYLWHLPLFQITDHFISPGILNVSVGIVLTFVASYFSYAYFEMPIRSWVRKKAE